MKLPVIILSLLAVLAPLAAGLCPAPLAASVSPRFLGVSAARHAAAPFAPFARRGVLQAAADGAADAPVVSPFSGGGGGGVVGSDLIGDGDDDSDEEDDDGMLALTKENVDRVLDEVRPYLIADGGNIAVVEVDAVERVVTLTLQGACGSCPSSTTTMKMGVERVLHEHFFDIREVREVSDEEDGGDGAAADGGAGGGAAAAGGSTTAAALMMGAVDAALDQIRPAIKGMGGEVELLSADPVSGVVEMRFEGPEKVRYGIEAVVGDVDQVKTVKFFIP